jgi:dolichyl-diphosphooligosaccharide--protein glycosyltransferase
VLAFLPGVFLRRTTAGFADHHAAEVFFHAVAVLAFLVALRVAETEKPIYELVVDRDWDALEKPTKYSALAGVALALYVWVWPPAIVLVGIIGVFYLLALGVKFGLGDSPDHIGYVGVVSMGVLSLFMVLRFDEFGFSASAISMLHVVLSFGVAAGAAFMVWLARQWENLPVARGLYPFSVLSIALFAVALVSFVAPSVWQPIQNNLFRTLAIGQTDTTLTIGEAQARPVMGPRYLSRLSNFLVSLYGLTFLTAFAGLGAVVYDGINERGRAEHLFVLVWTVFLFMMAITQVRFHYYFVLPIAVLNAYFVGTMLRATQIDSDFELTPLGTYIVRLLDEDGDWLAECIAQAEDIENEIRDEQTGESGLPVDEAERERAIQTETWRRLQDEFQEYTG